MSIARSLCMMRGLRVFTGSRNPNPPTRPAGHSTAILASVYFERPGVPPAGCDTRRPSLDHAATSSEAFSERWSLGRLGGFLFSLSFENKEKSRRAGLTPGPSKGDRFGRIWNKGF